MTAVRRLAAAVALLGLVACGSSREIGSDDSSAPSQPPAPATRDTAATAVAEAPVWFRQARALDLTGDGVADSAVVEARGERSDSLKLRLSFVVGGRRLFSQDWASEYELAMADSLRRHPPGSDAYVRGALQKVLARIQLARLDTSYVRDFPHDTAALALARRGPVRSIVVAYGYETVVTVVWDPAARRFLVAHACC